VADDFVSAVRNLRRNSINEFDGLEYFAYYLIYFIERL
jgi:hypothetical protein